ncbi:hypothetical protein WJX75_004980 [Coccomyxa subellipsoidea]|uniref:Uncharacterized protein n=1 Tax=Coccomyxa subellipsoidea TaxID=248742 RepID=A0ABR2YJB6_9CHLO
MAVFRQKRKNLEEPPQPFALETSGSCASTLSGAETFGAAKRRRTDQEFSMSGQDYQQQQANYPSSHLFGLQHYQAQPSSRFAFQPSLTLNRSNSAPDLRVLLSGPFNAVPQGVLHPQPPPCGGSSTASALIPYKAPEGSMLY